MRTTAANSTPVARGARRAALSCAAGVIFLILLATAGHAAPGPPIPDSGNGLGMYGNPESAAPYWRRQHSSDCAEMAVADVVGQMTAREPSEEQIDEVAQRLPSASGRGPVWSPPGNTNVRDLPALFAYYWIKSEYIHTATEALERDLAENRKIIVLLNAETVWDRPGRRDLANHFVVVTGIDTKAGVVHLNDSGIPDGRDEQIPLATFERAWAPYRNSAVVTKHW